MPIQISNADERCRCSISGALSIWQAAETWSALRPLLASRAPLCLDLGPVEACDGAGLQILWQIQLAAGAGSPICIAGISAELLSAMHRAGMESHGLMRLAQKE